jgi:hypothetical protein
MVSLILVLALDWVVKKSDSVLSHLFHPTGKHSVMAWPGLALAVLLVLLVWPVIVFCKAKQIIIGDPMQSFSEVPEFKITQKDLLAEMTLPEIEELETVLDPMGAVPRLPFGHLNPAWKKFLEQMRPSDIFWSFSTKYTPRKWSELRQGYVIVRGDEIGPYFIAENIFLNEEEKTPLKDKANDLFRDIPEFLRRHAD